MVKVMTRRGVMALLLGTVVIAGCAIAPSESPQSADPNVANPEITLVPAKTPELVVYSSPTCGCCGQWTEHMEAAGFTVKSTKTEAMDAIKARYNVPLGLYSCHTAVIGDYVVEGHIPAEDVRRLLAEKPDVAGIAVPGMPLGSPGMDAGGEKEPYTVFSFTASGERAVFAERS